MRYQRHLSVIGVDGQQKLQQASVLVIGCGGVGSPLLLYLAAAGIGKLGFIDNDQVELSNLQRQILFTTADISKQKSAVANSRLTELNPEITIIEYDTRLDIINASEILKQFDLVIDGSDNYPTRYLVNDICAKYNIPFISASVLTAHGQIAYFNIIDGCYRCLYPSPPPAVFSPNCAEAGVIGAVVGVVGTLAANMAINIILGKLNKPQLIFYNGDTLTTQALIFTQQSECCACIKKEINPLMIHQTCMMNSGNTNENKVNEVGDIVINKDKADSKMAKNNNEIVNEVFLGQINLNDYQLIDVREPWEHDISHIEGDVNIKLRDIYLERFTLSKNSDKPYLLYCKSGYRSYQAVKHLLELGYTHVYNLHGGIIEYMKQGV